MSDSERTAVDRATYARDRGFVIQYDLYVEQGGGWDAGGATLVTDAEHYGYGGENNHYIRYSDFVEAMMCMQTELAAAQADVARLDDRAFNADLYLKLALERESDGLAYVLPCVRRARTILDADRYAEEEK